MNIKLPRHGDELELVPTEIDDDGLAIARVDFYPMPASSQELDFRPVSASDPHGDSATRPDQRVLRRRIRIKIRGAVPGDRVRVVFLAGGPLPEVQLDRGAHRILEMVHAAPDVQAAARRFTRESSGSRTAAQERFLGAVERMLLAGLLTVC